MAHEISIVNGQAEAAFAGQKPWHNLGVQVTDLMSVQDAFRLAHLDWEVELRDLFFADGKAVPDRKAIFRMDTEEYFATCSPRFTPVQNAQQRDFIEAICGEGGVVECAGALQQGRRVFWTIRTDALKLKGNENETLQNYLVASNAHDGAESFRVMFTPVRVVCQNTLNAAIRGAKNCLALYHTSNVHERINAAKNLLSTSHSYLARLAEVGEMLMEQEVNDDFIAQFLTHVLGDENKKGVGPRAAENILAAKEQVSANMKAEWWALRKKGRATAWDLFNAVTYRTSHQMNAGLCKDNREKHMLSVLSGNAAELQQRAMDMLMTTNAWR